jgi:hypothetical protein
VSSLSTSALPELPSAAGRKLVGRRAVGLLIVAALAALAVVAGLLLRGDGGIPTGSALDAEGEGGIFQPLPPDTPVTLGIVSTMNLSAEPVQLVGARLLRLDPDVRLLGFSAVPYGPDGNGVGVPITALEHPLPRAVPLTRFPPLTARAKREQVVVLFALGVRPGGEGMAAGVEVHYRQGGKLRRQVFREQVFVCSVPSLKVDCPGHHDPNEVFGDFDDEVKRRPS